VILDMMVVLGAVCGPFPFFLGLGVTRGGI